MNKMKKKMIALVLITMLLLTSCKDKNGAQSVAVNDVEPTATYDWMAGESMVSTKRMGITRQGVNNSDHTVTPNGVYFMCGTGKFNENGDDISYVLYVDYGSDTVIKLCGRPDCDHNNEDCNAYFENGCNIYYDKGYLYATGGVGDECILYRMNKDGSNRVEIFDFSQFAKEQDADFAKCEMIDSGVCSIQIYRWKKTGNEFGGHSLEAEFVNAYLYNIDGSMEKPKLRNSGGALYHCGEVFLALMEGAQNGGYNDYDFSLGDWDVKTDTITYLTDHPGIAGFYGKEYGYYFRDGALIQLNYETREEKKILETELDGKYNVSFFPDCWVLACRSYDGVDRNLYIYNWNYELVDTIELSYLNGLPADGALIAETAERLILTDAHATWIPKYYIEKSELGTGNAKIHKFSLPDF